MNFKPPAKTAAAMACGLISVVLFFILSVFMADGYHGPYWIVALAALLGIALYMARRQYGIERRKRNYRIWPVYAGSIVFALFVTLANYPMWLAENTGTTSPKISIFVLLAWLFAGAGTGWFALYGFFHVLRRLRSKKKPNARLRKPYQVFLISFGTLGGIFLLIGWFALYPGLWTSDSLSQISQALSVIYTNHPTAAHTFLIKIVLDFAGIFTQDINQKLFVFSAFQALCLAAALAWSFQTICQYTKNNWVWISCLVFASCMYYNWFYAVTVWKDIFFAIVCLVFVTALLRELAGLTPSWLNYVLCVLSCLGICLFRENGRIALCAFALVMIVFCWKKFRVFKICLLGTIAASFLVSNVLYPALNIEESEMVESLSVPIQQVARVVVNERELTQEQEDYITYLLPLEYIRRSYQYWLADNIKFPIDGAQQEYMRKEGSGYIRMYLDLLMAYPADYLAAWIDQTVGYWNGGYDYWRVAQLKDASSNELGLSNTTRWPWLYNFISGVQDFTDTYLTPLVSIGFNVWLVIALFLYEISRKSDYWIAGLFIIFVVGTLWIATPVYSEFRYAYMVFLCLPLFFGFALGKPGRFLSPLKKKQDTPRKQNKTHKSKT